VTVVVLEDKASKKTRQLEDKSKDLKREKELTKTLEFPSAMFLAKYILP
jgi:hypothetical protein